MYKYTLLVYIYTKARFCPMEGQNTLPKEGVVTEVLRLCTTYSEAWNGLLHLVRGELLEGFLCPRELRPL